MEYPVKEKKPENRALWFTDSFGDHNGVSMVLQSMHREIKERDLPIDLLVCSNTVQPDRNLIVLKPISEFNIPFYPQQPLRIPNFISIQLAFRKGQYDRIICSTEGPMGLAALYLKKVYSVKSYFYLHTDWIIFAKQVMAMEEAGLNRLQRMMRIYYNRFDRIFVLNTDQQKWLTGDFMRFSPSRILMTAHWADEIFTNHNRDKHHERISRNDKPVVLFTGRISKEKGVFELPEIFRKVREKIPNLRMVVAGTGPSEHDLKIAFPEAEFSGWINHDQLPDTYASADLLVLPSRFDTFSCVVLEALSCGLPVIAYNTKGPKDIIQDSVNGFLVETADEMADRIIGYFSDQDLPVSFKRAALNRARDFSADKILSQLLRDIEIQPSSLINGNPTT